MRSRHFLFIGKIVSTLFLLVMIFAWAFFVFAILPLILILIYHGKKKNVSPLTTAMAISPVLILAVLILKIWNVSDHPIQKMISRGAVA